MEQVEETKAKRRYGFFRWIIILLIVANIFAARAIAPILPVIEVPAEKITHLFGDYYLTNTLVATLIGDIILILMAFAVFRATRREDDVLTGVAGIVELMVEGIYNLVESTAGKAARRIFPWVATIILVVLVANFLEVIPGVDSIGLVHEVHDGEGYPLKEVLPGVQTIVNEPVSEDDHGHLYHIIPFVRVASTDLNFTLAIALVSVFMTQVIGVRALGIGYFKKFFNFGEVVRMWGRENLGPFELLFPFLDIFVSLLEIVAEIAKVFSFTFRLFGNIFAGSVLLFLIGSLVPVFLQSGIVLFELLVGAVQALVFGMLTMVFMTMATQSHDEH